MKRVLAGLGGLVSFVVMDCVVAVVRDRVKPPALVIDRATAQRVEEPRPLIDNVQMSLVWTSITGSRVLCRTRAFLDYLEGMTISSGETMNTPESVERIDGFIRDNGVDISDLDRDLNDFSTLNEFFGRPLRAGARPIDSPDDATVAVSPADCRLRCFNQHDGEAMVDVKSHQIDIARLLGTSAKSGGSGAHPVDAFYEQTRAAGFAVAVCRLAPCDYHRFHWPVDARWSRDDVLDIVGDYHSVSPTAVRSAVDVLGTNRRVTVPFESDEFGPGALVIVGALKVGSVELAEADGQVRRGDELGRFLYGGSTVVLIMGADRIDFDQDLVSPAVPGAEVLVRMGQSLGQSTHTSR